MAFRVQPQRDVIVIENTPAGPSDPSVDLSRDRTMRISSCIGIDATRPFGEPFYDVADVPGWQDFDMPETSVAASRPAGPSRTVTAWCSVEMNWFGELGCAISFFRTYY